MLNLPLVVERYILDALMRWITGSQSTSMRIDGDMHQIITAGIGHLKQLEPTKQSVPQDPRRAERPWLKADGNGDVRGWECVEQIFPDVGTRPCLA